MDENDYKFCWIVDFPFFEKDENGNLEFSHNPFSLPQSSIEEIKKNPLEAKAYQYDLVINGYESLSGGVRNYNPELMVELFKIAGYGKEPIAKATVSQHLTALKEAGLIQGEIEAPKVKYCINKENWRLARELFGEFLGQCVCKTGGNCCER